MSKPVEKEEFGLNDFFFWLLPLEKRKWHWVDLILVPVETPSLARCARGPALLYSACAALLWLIAFILGLFTPSTVGHWTLLYALLWILVGWGLFRMRPEASVVGFVLSALGFLKGVSGSFLAVGLVWAFTNAVRGTFTYRRLIRLDESRP